MAFENATLPEFVLIPSQVSLRNALTKEGLVIPASVDAHLFALEPSAA
jgi:hypothetical protein